MLKDFDSSDYSMVVKSRAPLPRPWRWEIYCAGKRQPIQRSEVFFESRAKASAVGKEALARLLEKLQSGSLRPITPSPAAPGAPR